MNLRKFLVGATASVVMLGAMITTAFAATPNWDITGSWLALHGYGGNTYTHVNNITQAPDGTLTGSGGWNGTVNGVPSVGTPNTWEVTSGSLVDGDTFHMNYHYTSGEACEGTVDAAINSDGSMTGSWTDDCYGARTGEWTTDAGIAKAILALSVPKITTPSNGATVTVSNMVKVDWTDSTGGTPPIRYQYQAFSDAGYTGLIYDSDMTLTASEIPTPGTSVGVYYLRVRAQGAVGPETAWSNGSGDPYKVTVIADSVLVGPPTNKDQCKKGGWKTFNNPTFKNQGECVAFVEHLLCNKHEKGVVSFNADESLYYSGPTDAAPIYGSGPISFTWDKKTGEVTGGYYTETVPPDKGTVYYNIVTGGSVIGDVVKLEFDRTNPNIYGFSFIGTLKDKVLTGQMDGPYLFTATGRVNKDEHGNCQRYDRWNGHYDKDHRGWIWDNNNGGHRNDEHDKPNK